MLRTAPATGLCPSASSSAWYQVPGSSSRAATTTATSAPGTVPPGTGGAASRTLPVAGASVRPPGRRMARSKVQGAQIGLGGGLRRDAGSPDLIAAGAAAAARLPLRETCTNLQSQGRPAALATSTEPARPAESLRGAPLPGPAPAANTTASALDSSTATASAPPLAHRPRGPGSRSALRPGRRAQPGGARSSRARPRSQRACRQPTYRITGRSASGPSRDRQPDRGEIHLLRPPGWLISRRLGPARRLAGRIRAG